MVGWGCMLPICAPLFLPPPAGARRVTRARSLTRLRRLEDGLVLLPSQLRVVLAQDPENPPEELLVKVVAARAVPGEAAAGGLLGAAVGVVVAGALLVLL